MILLLSNTSTYEHQPKFIKTHRDPFGFNLKNKEGEKKDRTKGMITGLNLF